MAKGNNSKMLEQILAKKDTDVLDEHIFVGSRVARINFSKLVKTTKNDQNKLVITEHGEPVAALIPIKQLKILDWIERHNLTDKYVDAAYRNMSYDELIDLVENGDEGDEREPGRKNKNAA